MRRIASRFPSRALTCFAAAALIAVGAAGCGDDGEDMQSLTFTLGEETGSAQLTGPESAEPGFAEITLENEGESRSDLQLIRVEGNHSPEEAVEGLDKAMRGQPLPEWFFAGGGVGRTPPGDTRTVTQVLQPGTYYAFDTEGNEGPPDPDTAASVEVSGEAADEEIGGGQRLSAFEYGFYGFEAGGLTREGDEFIFWNSGTQPHHIVYAPLRGDANLEDVERFFDSEKGKPPFDEAEVKSTAVIEGGERQRIDWELEPGRYVMLCFISDRRGGPPHVAKGMIDVFRIAE